MSFNKLYEKYFFEINKCLETFFNKQLIQLRTKEPFIKECYSMIKEFTMMGGKRLRPISLILAYNACGGKEEKKIILPAIGIEIHQSYSIILDDIMDEDDYRRGKPGINKRLKDYFSEKFNDTKYQGNLFNLKSSRFAVSNAMMLANIANILSERALLASGFSDDKLIKAIRIMGEIDELIYHGQMSDILMEYNNNLNEQDYLEMIRLKTGVFFGMAFELGSIFSSADENKQFIFKEFGTNIGFSFQIQDDLLDITTGKGHELGSDIKKGKKTLLMIKTLEKADETQKKIIYKIFGNSGASEDAVKSVFRIMHETGAIDYCTKLAQQLNSNANDYLKKLDLDMYYKTIFSELTNYMVNRIV